MAGILNRAGLYWKAAAGCAICASLVAGLIEDVRHAVTDRISNLIFPAATDFDACRDRHFDANPRPDARPYHILVTVPLGDADRSQFRLIDRSLRRLYGEDAAGAIQVEAFDCPPLQPGTGVAAQATEVARARAADLLSRARADVVIWGEVLVAGQSMELRFAVPEPSDGRKDYAVDSIVLTPGFGTDLGALIAAKALTSAREVLDERDAAHLARLDRALAITGPLVDTPPAGIGAASQADIVFAHALALSEKANITGDAGTGLAAVEHYRIAVALYDPQANARMWLAAQMNIASGLIEAATIRPPAEARVAIADAIGTYRDLLARAEPAVEGDQRLYLQSVLATALGMQGDLVGGAEGKTMVAEAVTLQLAVLQGHDRARDLRGWAEAQFNLAGAALQLSRVTDGAPGWFYLRMSEQAIRAATAVLSREADPVDWASAQTLLGIALSSVATGLAEDERRAYLTEALAAHEAAISIKTEAAYPVDWAYAKGNIGVVLNQLALDDGGESAARLLHDARAAHEAATTVFTREANLVEWALVQENLAYVARDCAAVPECGARDAELARAIDHVEAALAVYTEGQMQRYLAKAEILRDELLAARSTGP